jgi:hypothetical protein
MTTTATRPRAPTTCRPSPVLEPAAGLRRRDVRSPYLYELPRTRVA